MKARVDPDDFNACPSFNEWLDERHMSENGPLSILGFELRPSYVLHQLSFDTYQAALADYLTEREEELKETVYSKFPTPIAYYYYRFENGYENELQRLHFLRDTWESIVDVVHALTVSECRFRRITLSDPIRFKDLLSDSIDDRLLTIERIIDQAKTSGVQLAIQSIFNSSALTRIRDLNRVRNVFSHSAAQSEKQAREWISEGYADVVDVLEDLVSLADVKVARYMSHADANTLRCEVFKGHHLTRTIQLISISRAQALSSAGCFRKDRLFAVCGEHLFSLQPFVHFREEESGHATKLLAFRRTRGEAPDRMLEFEITGEASRSDIDRTTFSTEMNELRMLFGLGPD